MSVLKIAHVPVLWDVCVCCCTCLASRFPFYRCGGRERGKKACLMWCLRRQIRGTTLFCSHVLFSWQLLAGTGLCPRCSQKINPRISPDLCWHCWIFWGILAPWDDLEEEPGCRAGTTWGRFWGAASLKKFISYICLEKSPSKAFRRTFKSDNHFHPLSSSFL